MRPKDYKELDSCASCKYVFKMEEHDNPTSYYCHQDKSKRPKCGSVFMGEYFGWNKGTGDYDWDTWEEWADPREVKGWGWCSQYRKRDD